MVRYYVSSFDYYTELQMAKMNISSIELFDYPFSR